MAKVILDADIEALSGKLSKTKSAMYCYNKKTGKCYRAEYADHSDSNTTDQQAVRSTFKQKMQTAKAWWTANKPASSTAEQTDEWKAMLTAYDNQTKYGNKWVFVRSKLKNADSISFTGNATSGGSSTPTGGTTQEGA